MKKQIFTLILCVVATVAYSQDTTKSAFEPDSLKPIEEVFDGVGEQPSFPGGENEMMTWIGNNIVYPQEAINDSIMGKVYVQFIVEKEGHLTNVEIMRSPHESLSKEVIRMVESMPNWKPGTMDGKAVRVRYTLPVNFTL